MKATHFRQSMVPRNAQAYDIGMGHCQSSSRSFRLPPNVSPKQTYVTIADTAQYSSCLRLPTSRRRDDASSPIATRVHAPGHVPVMVALLTAGTWATSPMVRSSDQACSSEAAADGHGTVRERVMDRNTIVSWFKPRSIAWR